VLPLPFRLAGPYPFEVGPNTERVRQAGVAHRHRSQIAFASVDDAPRTGHRSQIAFASVDDAPRTGKNIDCG